MNPGSERPEASGEDRRQTSKLLYRVIPRPSADK